MSKVELGTVGAVVHTGKGDVDAAVELEGLGFSTIWTGGAELDNLGQIAELVRATKQVQVATGILPVVRFDADEVAAFYTDLEAGHPGRFVLGLGGAHVPNPISTLNAYLDSLDAEPAQVPASRRIMAALGPRMLDLARTRAAGAYPVLVTPEYTARARSQLGDDTTLAVNVLVVVETDPERARTIARGPLGFLGNVPAYQANFRRMGFTDDEIANRADRLVDTLVPWGDADSVAARVKEHLEAGADHVTISVTTDAPQPRPVDQYRQLAQRLLPA